MSRTVTLSELKEAIRTRYDLPAYSSTTFVTTTAINAAVNASLQSFYGILLETYGDDYYTTYSSITASAATTTLPSRCTKLISLYWQRGTDDVVRIEQAQQEDTALGAYSSKSWNDYGPRYRLLGQTSIRWFPTPNASYTVLATYVALPADLTLDADTVVFGPGWEEWVVLDVCRKIAAREEKDVDPWLAERADVEARIRAQAPERAEADALQLRDTASPLGRMSAYALRNYLTNQGL